MLTLLKAKDDPQEQLCHDISVLTQYGFTFASRRVFNLFSPQRKRPCYFKMKGKWTIYDPQDGVNGLAVLGDDPALLCRNFVRDFCPGL